MCHVNKCKSCFESAADKDKFLITRIDTMIGYVSARVNTEMDKHGFNLVEFVAVHGAFFDFVGDVCIKPLHDPLESRLCHFAQPSLYENDETQIFTINDRMQYVWQIPVIRKEVERVIQKIKDYRRGRVAIESAQKKSKVDE